MSEVKHHRSTNALLDADWARLESYSGRTEKRDRKAFHALNFRFLPVVLWRYSHALEKREWRLTARMLGMLNFVLFGLEVPTRLSPGPGFVIFHTQGTILGASSIGCNVSIYQQVTLGASEPDFSYDHSKRPIIEDNVSITAGAKIIGGIRIGANSIIAANAVVLKDVPEDSLAIGIPARFVPRKQKNGGCTKIHE